MPALPTRASVVDRAHRARPAPRRSPVAFHTAALNAPERAGAVRQRMGAALANVDRDVLENVLAAHVDNSAARKLDARGRLTSNLDFVAYLRREGAHVPGYTEALDKSLAKSARLQTALVEGLATVDQVIDEIEALAPGEGLWLPVSTKMHAVDLWFERTDDQRLRVVQAEKYYRAPGAGLLAYEALQGRLSQDARASLRTLLSSPKKALGNFEVLDRLLRRIGRRRMLPHKEHRAQLGMTCWVAGRHVLMTHLLGEDGHREAKRGYTGDVGRALGAEGRRALRAHEEVRAEKRVRRAIDDVSTLDALDTQGRPLLLTALLRDDLGHRSIARARAGEVLEGLALAAVQDTIEEPVDAAAATATDRLGLTPIDWAAAAGNANALGALLEAVGRVPPRIARRALSIALESRRTDVDEVLLALARHVPEDVSERVEVARLIAAIASNDPGRVAERLAHGAGRVAHLAADAFGSTAVDRAAGTPSFELVLAAAADTLGAVDARGRTALHRLASRDDVGALVDAVPLEALRARDADGYTPFGRAARAGNSALALRMLERDPTLAHGTERTGRAFTPLMLAVRERSGLPLFRALLAMHAVDAHAFDTLKANALQHAVHAGNVEAVRALLAVGADADVENKAGDSARALAARSKVPGRIRRALQAHASRTPRVDDVDTHFAAPAKPVDRGAWRAAHRPPTPGVLSTSPTTPAIAIAARPELARAAAATPMAPTPPALPARPLPTSATTPAIAIAARPELARAMAAARQAPPLPPRTGGVSATTPAIAIAARPALARAAAFRGPAPEVRADLRETLSRVLTTRTLSPRPVDKRPTTTSTSAHVDVHMAAHAARAAAASAAARVDEARRPPPLPPRRVPLAPRERPLRPEPLPPAPRVDDELLARARRLRTRTKPLWQPALRGLRRVASHLLHAH